MDNIFTEDVNKIVQMMIKESNQLIRQKRVHMERGKLK